MSNSMNKTQILLIAGLLLLVALIGVLPSKGTPPALGQTSIHADEVAPPSGVVLPVEWGDLGAKLVSNGVIDASKLEALYSQGAFTIEDKNLLLGQGNGKLKITKENAGYLLNLLWALGLANKNPILDAGEMTNPSYGGAQNFASTGGWTISKGSPMDHYSRHAVIVLTPAQQKLVDDVSENIYRPCCDNPTHFPDCNHGMAMLGLLELMASQGKNEDEMYRAALTMNSYWFPSQYQTLVAYFASKGTSWKDISPKEVLSKEYSSASGYGRIAALMQPQQSGSASCSV